MEYLTTQLRGEERIPKRRPGRPKAVDTDAAKRRKLMLLRKQDIFEAKTNEDNCLYDTNKCPCGEHHQVWPASLIAKLRLVLLTLSPVKQRQFLQCGVRCDLNEPALNRHQARLDADAADTTSLSNTKLHINYRLEKPAILHPKLDRFLLNRQEFGREDELLRAPARSDCIETCQIHMCWAIGRSVKFVNQQDPNVRSRDQRLGLHDRVFDVDPVRRVVKPRVAAKREVCLQWFAQMQKEHLVLPGQEGTVLPFKTKREAHANFVLDVEAKYLDPEAAQMSRDLMFGCLVAGDDCEEEGIQAEPGEAEQDGALAAANRLALRRPGRSRYGNVLLGERGRVQESPEVASFEVFCAVWRSGDVGKRVKIRKWMPFSKCDMCTGHRQRMRTVKCPEEQGKMKASYMEHLDLVRRERSGYMLRQRLARMQPHRYLSLIIDGADGTKFEQPHLHERSHASDAVRKIKLHLLGCIAHSRDTYAFTCPPHIAQGHNITIQVLHEVLVDIKRKEGSLPPILHIQLDNTTKQNKGKYVVAYLAWLVKTGVIREAYMNFLPVGHTHEDIDQYFSRVSVWCRHHDAPTVSALHTGLRRCFKKYGKRPIVAGWTAVGNLSAYFKPFLIKNVTRDITQYRQIRVRLGREGAIKGIPIMQVRTWPMGDPAKDFWRGTLPDTSFNLVFDADGARQPDLFRDYDEVPPQAQPECVGVDPRGEARAAYTANLERQARDIEGLMRMHPSVFDEDAQVEVRALLASLSSNLDAQNPVRFGWCREAMALLYSETEYMDHAAPCDEEHNIFDSGAAAAVAAARPDPQEDPRGFQEALASGEMSQHEHENCHACVLRQGDFYLCRPADNDDAPFLLAKVKRIICEAGAENSRRGIQTGAFVAIWACGVSQDPAVDWFSDPYMATDGHADGQPIRQRADGAWTCGYDQKPLSDFQDCVRMVKWKKPAGWSKTWDGDPARVDKFRIRARDVAKVRNFVWRWTQGED